MTAYRLPDPREIGIQRAARAGVILAFLRGLLGFEPSVKLRQLLSEPVADDDQPATDPRQAAELRQSWQLYLES